jgi:predicted transcriptional regulator
MLRPSADACYVVGMRTAAESVQLDEDVHEELRKLAERSGRALGALANDALRDFLRYETQVAAAVDRGIADLDAGRTRMTADVFALLEQQRLARSRG